MHLLGHLGDLRRHDMVWDDIFELVEPEEREFRKDSALVWNALTLGGVKWDLDTQRGVITFFRMTSYADMRSDATKSRCSSEDVA
jgi:hypothetical protein